MNVNEVADIKRLKLSLGQSVKSVQADVDNYLIWAEGKSVILYLIKGNNFRKTVQEKEDSVKDLDQAIGKLECELKNLK